MELYKVLDGRRSVHGGSGGWRPGRWRAVRGKAPLVPCWRGLHLARREDLRFWLGPEIWVAEYDGDEPIVAYGHKVVVRRARIVSRVETWDARTARRYLIDCAKRVLPAYERAMEGQNPDPGDDRPRLAILAAEGYLEGLVSAEKMEQAGRRAWDAVMDLPYVCAAAFRAAALAEKAACSEEEVLWRVREPAWSYESAVWMDELLFDYLEGRRS